MHPFFGNTPLDEAAQAANRAMDSEGGVTKEAFAQLLLAMCQIERRTGWGLRLSVVGGKGLSMEVHSDTHTQYFVGNDVGEFLAHVIAYMPEADHWVETKLLAGIMETLVAEMLPPKPNPSEPSAN